MKIRILTTHPSSDYELIDSGEGEKLERYRGIVLSRPDPQALWEKKNPGMWKQAQGVFSRTQRQEKAEWKLDATVPAKWPIEFGGLHFNIKPSSFKHTGLFPEQLPQWEWMQNLIKDNPPIGEKKIKVLNLFGYTGGATLALAQLGAEVVHVDASKGAINWAKENAALSGLSDASIRWILDDARTFVEREIKRGNTYDAIIMDPPAFGRGPEGEVWKIEDHFLDLLKISRTLLTPQPLFFLVNGYASGYSVIAYETIVQEIMHEAGGVVEAGELTIEERVGKRLLPSGIFARWNRV